MRVLLIVCLLLFSACPAMAGSLTIQSSAGASGAPTDVDYLVGTANGPLSAEIVVGTTPGGELGGTWGSPTLDDNVTVTGWVMGASTATTPDANDADTSLATTAFCETAQNYLKTSENDDNAASLTNIQTACTSDFHNIGGTDDDTPDSDSEVPDTITVGASGSVNDAAIPSGITRDTEWDSASEINAATTDADFLTAEVDGSTTNEIEVVDEAYSAVNFNGGTTSAVSQDDFYDYSHIFDTDDDGDVDVVDATVWATKQAADADLTDLADGRLTASKVAGVADADYGDITVSAGAWAVENDSHDHSAAGSTVTVAAADITDKNAGTDITADLEEEVTAGRSLTKTDQDILADAELYTHTRGIYIEDPTADDDFKSLWCPSHAVTITRIWAESDQTVTFMLQVDDGSATDVDTVDLAPAAGTAEDTSLDGDATLAAGDRLDLAVTSVANTPTWVSIQWTYIEDD